MTDTQQLGPAGQLLFLGTAIAILLSGHLLFAAGISAPTAAVAATVAVAALLVLPGRLVVWVLGTALFLSIAILPYYLYFGFAADSTTRLAFLAGTANIFLLLWFAKTFGALKTPS